jgi:hypothetical protein
MRVLLSLFFVVSAAMAQNAISAKAGLVHYAEGDVIVAGRPVEKKVGVFTTMRAGETMSTAEGRAEVLMSPGVFVRVSENTTFKLVNAELSDVRLELASGVLIVEAADSIKENKLTITANGATLSPRKDGVFTVDASEGSVRLWNGELSVGQDGRETLLKGGRQLALTAGASPEKFDADSTDALYRWAKRRSSYIALANVSGARQNDRWMNQGMGSWYWNPYFNMYTYIPSRGVWNSPFGFRYFSPGAVIAMFVPQMPVMGGGFGRGADSPGFNSSLGYNTVGARSMGGYSAGGGGAAAAPAPESSPRTDAGGGARSGGGRGN